MCGAVRTLQFFCDWLSEATEDFRVDDSFLHKTAVACFGCGNSLYEQHFNAVATQVSSSASPFHHFPLLCVLAVSYSSDDAFLVYVRLS